MSERAWSVGVVTGDAGIALVLEQAAALILQAFPQPAMETSEALLRWHLTGLRLQGAVPHVAVATIDGHLVGFAGATPRLVTCGSMTAPAHVVSFVAVDPAMQGRGIAARLYDALLPVVRDNGGRVLTFAIDGGGGMAAIQSAYPRNRFDGTDLGIVPSVGITRGRILDGNADEPAPPFSPILALAPDRDQDRHLADDPRGATRIGSGSSYAVNAWRLGLTRDPLLLLESVPAAMSAPQFRALVTEAFEVATEPGKMLIIPNFSAQDDGVARAVGARRLPGAPYRAFFWSAIPEDPMLNATATTHPVV